MKSLIIIIFLVTACGEFVYSPYVVKTKKLNLNQKNLDRLNGFQRETSAPYKVAVISDTHDYYDDLEDQVNFINQNNFKMTLVSGDMTNIGLVSEYEATIKRLNRLKAPYFVTSGNHDLLIDGAKIFKDYFGSDNYSFTIGSTSYILMNNNNWESKVIAPNLSWFEIELIKHSGKRIVVVAHCPYDDSARFSPNEIKTFENLLIKYDVQYFLNGHNHNPLDDFTRDNSFKSITVGSSSKRVVFELQVSEHEMTHRFHKL